MAKTHTICLITDECTHAVALKRQGRRWEIIARGSHATINPDSPLADCDMAAVADGAGEALREAEVDAPHITLVIPQQWCFTHALATKGAAPSALAFAFEEFLPLPLEDVTCAFAPLGAEHTLAVGVPTKPMVDLVRQLAGHGVDVQRIVVDTIVATQTLGTTAVPAVVVDRRWIRTIPTAGETPTITRTPPVTETNSVVATAVRDICGGATDGDANGDTEGNADSGTNGDSANNSDYRVFDLAGQYSTEPSESVTDLDNPRMVVLDPEAAVAALAMTAAASPTSIDLRSGSLAGDHGAERLQRLATHCLKLSIMAMMILCGGLLLARRGVSDRLATVGAQRRSVYVETFNTPPPLGAALRLASERVKLECLTRQTSADGDRHSLDSSPLDVLRYIVEGLPADLRIMLLDARLEERQVTLRGQTASHRDAERIVETINGVAGLTAHPPRTTRLSDGGVEFSIVAVRDNGDG